MGRTDRDDDLLMGALDGQLSEDDLHVLAGRLKEEPQLARRMMEVARDESLLAEVLAKPDAQAWSPGAARPRPERARPARVLWGMWISVAACLAIIVGALVYNARQEERFVQVLVARIEKTAPDVEVIRASDGNTVVAVMGMDLFARDRIRTRDGERAVIAYPEEDTRVSVGEDTLLEIGDVKDGKRLHLGTGLIRVMAAPQPEGRPMVVTTKHAKAEVVGTAFYLRARPDATTLTVTTGQVRFTRLSDGERIDVAAAFRATAAAGIDLAARQVKYVDDRIVLHDDFDRYRDAKFPVRVGGKDPDPAPLGRWRCLLWKKGSKEGTIQQVLPTEEHVRQLLSFPEVKLGGRSTRVLQLDFDAFSDRPAGVLSAAVILNPSLSESTRHGPVSAEFDIRFRDGTDASFMIGRGGKEPRYSFGGPSPSLNKLKDARARVECVPRIEADGSPAFEIKWYRGGKFVSHAMFYYEEFYLAFALSRGMVRVDNMVVREMVPAEDE